MTTAPDQRVSISQAFLAAIVESSDDAIVSKDLNGVVASWNAGAERIFGYAAEEMVGRSITKIIPAAHLGEETEILDRIRRGERIAHFETTRQRKDGRLIAISLTVSPIQSAEGLVIGASKIARDITERKAAEARYHQQAQRLEALNRMARAIASDFDTERIVQRVTDAATELTGAQFGAFFYNVQHRGEAAYLLFTLSGAPRGAFERFGLPRATAVFAPTFHGTGVVRSDDIRLDQRYGKNAPHYGMPEGHLPVVSYLAVPVLGPSGEVLGGLFFGHSEVARFDQETEEVALGIAAHAAIALENARLFKSVQEEVRGNELLLREFKHRVRNTLATVQAIAAQTMRGAPRVEREAFEARLRALAEAHDLLTDRDWQQASLVDLVRRVLAPFERDRFVIDGPEVALGSKRALALTLALHELATNAVKYGALSASEGCVSISWSVEGDKLELTWRESGGPPVVPPTRKGFGSVLIGQATEGNVRMEHNAEGLLCVVLVPLGE